MGVVVYLCSFVLGILLSIISSLYFSQTGKTNTIISLINLVLMVVIVALFSLYYFKDNKIKADVKEGLKFGLVLIVIGFVFDWVGFLISIARNSPQDLINYYSNPYFWIALILLIGTSALVGHIKGKSQ